MIAAAQFTAPDSLAQHAFAAGAWDGRIQEIARKFIVFKDTLNRRKLNADQTDLANRLLMAIEISLESLGESTSASLESRLEIEEDFSAQIDRQLDDLSELSDQLLTAAFAPAQEILQTNLRV